MFRKVLIFSWFAVVLVSIPLRAELAGPNNDTGADPGKNFGLDRTAEGANYKDPKVKSSPTEIFVTVNKIVTALLSLLAILFFGFLTFAGVRWMTAQGNEEFVTKAKETMEAALIGLIIVMSAYAITNFVFTKVQERAGQTSVAP